MRYALAISFLCIIGSVQAGPIKWTLQNVTLSDGATASGHFILDADTQVFSVIDIDVTGGSFLPDAHYDLDGLVFGGSPILIVTGDHGSTLSLAFSEGLWSSTEETLQDDILPGTFGEYWPGKFNFESHQYVSDGTQTEDLNPILGGSVVGTHLQLAPKTIITFDAGTYTCDPRPGTQECDIVSSEGYEFETINPGTNDLFRIINGELVWDRYLSAELRASDDSGFWLHSIVVDNPAVVDYLVVGHLVGGGTVQQVADVGSNNQKIVFDSNWRYLDRVVINSPDGNFIPRIDNVSLSPIPITVEVDVIGEVHPHHVGNGGLPNDTVPVAVMGSSTWLGDPEDMLVSLIDPAAVRFGPLGASIDPTSTPDLDYNHDNDGIPDARLEFKMRDIGFPYTPGSGFPCSASPAELVGETTTGRQFVGEDTTVNVACTATCH